MSNEDNTNEFLGGCFGYFVGLIIVEVILAYISYPDWKDIILSTVSIRIVADWVALSCQDTRKLKRATCDMALMKLIYLAVQNISKKWTHPIQNWALTIQQLSIRFGDRITLSL